MALLVFILATFFLVSIENELIYLLKYIKVVFRSRRALQTCSEYWKKRGIS